MRRSSLFDNFEGSFEDGAIVVVCAGDGGKDGRWGAGEGELAVHAQRPAGLSNHKIGYWLARWGYQMSCGG